MEDVITRVPEAATPTAVVAPDKPARTDAIRAGDRLRQIKSRAAKAAREKVVAYKWDSNQEPTKSEAYDILRTRIKNEHVVETVYDISLKVAEEHDLTANRFFFANGLQQTLLSTKGHEQPLVMEHDALVASEVLHRGDCYAIWDVSVAPREPEVTFEAFLTMRAEAKGSWYTLGVEFMDKQFEPQPHKGWERFLPSFIPNLKPGYVQKEMGIWLGSQRSEEHPAEIREYLILASRNSFKSSVGLCYLTTALLCCPSLRLLLVSETLKLAKDFIRLFRSLWEVGFEPTRLQYWWPEMTIAQGEGSVLSFSCPMRTLKLAQDSVCISSLEVAMAGQRYDVGWFDDTVSNMNTGTDEACAKGVQVFEALLKTRELNANSGLTCIAGTAWKIGDLYHELIRRNDAALLGQQTMAIKVEPAWIVKPSAKHLPILMLTEDMVDLTFPSRLTFTLLMKEARANLNLFRSQNLVEYFDEDSDSRVTFTREALDKAVRPPSAFTMAKRSFRVLCVDPSHSISRTADYTAAAIIDFLETLNETTGMLDNIAFIKDFRLERLKTSEVAVLIHDLHQQWRPTTPGGDLRCVIEKSGDHHSLAEAIQRTYLLRGHPLLNVYWKNVANIQGGASVLAKTNRIKGYCEVALNQDRLFFSSGIACLEEVFNQFIKFDGVHRSGSTRKDDAPDCVSIALSTFLPRTEAQAAEEKPDEALLEFERLNQQQQMLLAQHDRVFGSPPDTAMQFQRDNLEPEAFQGLYQTLGKFHMTRRAA
jgi:hypothetical protein